MLDSRKLLFALVVVALAAVPAFAQNPPLSCFAQAAGTPSIRAEGVTELIGDIIINCTGGNPTPANQNLRQVTIQIFTAPTINITSRIQDSSFGGFSEAVLFIDEPAVAPVDVQTMCGSTVFPYSVPILGPFPPPAPPAAPTTYIEQGSPETAPAPQPQGYWYYCAESKTYYPYVKECAGSWQRVTPQPPPGG